MMVNQLPKRPSLGLSTNGDILRLRIRKAPATSTGTNKISRSTPEYWETVYVPEEQFENCWKQMEAARILNYLPEHVWIFVTEKLTQKNEAEILEALSNSSLFFRDITRNNQTFFLFSKVGLILADQCHHNNCQLPSYNEPSQPFLNNLPSLTDLLNMRLVCTLWCDTIDAYHQNIVFTSCLIKNNTLSTENISPLVNRFECKTDYDKFTSHFALTHDPVGRSPFIGNSVILRYNDIKQGEKSSTIKFLLLYGPHIQYISLENVINVNIGSSYFNLKVIFNLTPNLLLLELDHRISPFENMDQLKRNIECVPFRHFENLKVLRFVNTSLTISNHLIQKNTHVAKIDFRDVEQPKGKCGGQYFCFANDIYKVPLPNLTDLSVRCVSLLDLKRLARPSSNWPLVRLSLFIDFPLLNFDLAKWTQSIFDVITQNNREHTLTDVELNFSKNWSLSHGNENRFRSADEFYTYPIPDIRTLVLNLPNLKNFKIVMRPPLPLDFLLPAKNSLKCLTIEFNGQLNNPSLHRVFEFIEKFSIVKFWNHLINSELPFNIWQIFTVLEELTMPCIGGKFTFERNGGSFFE